MTSRPFMVVFGNRHIRSISEVYFLDEVVISCCEFESSNVPNFSYFSMFSSTSIDSLKASPRFHSRMPQKPRRHKETLTCTWRTESPSTNPFENKLIILQCDIDIKKTSSNNCVVMSEIIQMLLLNGQINVMITYLEKIPGPSERLPSDCKQPGPGLHVQRSFLFEESRSRTDHRAELKQQLVTGAEMKGPKAAAAPFQIAAFAVCVCVRSR